MLDWLTISLMLAAGLLHASWHALVKSGSDQMLVLAGMSAVAGAISACALPFLGVPNLQVWLIIGGSVLLHLGYKVALARSYAYGDLGQAFPMARGFVPLCATAIAFVLLGDIPTIGQLVGIVIVSAGLAWLAADSIHGGVDRRLFLAALAAGLTVAGYSAIDAYGTRIADSWATFTAWLVVADSFCFLLLVRALQGRQVWGLLWRDRGRMIASGVFGLTSFAVFLWALSRGPVGAVSALRESSVLFAALIGMTIYGERRSSRRFGAAAVIFAGLCAIATQ